MVMLKSIPQGKNKSQEGEPQKSSADLVAEDPNQTSRSTICVKSLNGTETFLASSGEFELMSSTSTSKDHIITEADFPDNLSSVSSASTENSSLPPVTARIEISPGTSNGSPMKISIKPTPTPRPSSGIPSLSSTMSRNLNYASSTNDSWDSSSADSTPRDSVLTKVRRISGNELIASQRKPGGGDVDDKAIIEQDEDVRSLSDSVSSSDNVNSKPENNTNDKPVEEEMLQKSSKSAVHSAPKALSPKVPPPVAPKPRISTSVSSNKSDDSKDLLDSPKSPPAVAARTKSSSSISEDTKEKEGPKEKGDSLASSVKVSKVSAGYERLQAINKAKPTKPSRIIEKSRTNVSSKAKMFESEADDKADASKEKHVPAPKPFNSSLLPMSERRKSTGSYTNQVSSSLTRPKSLLPKGNLSKESSIPEHTSPTQESKDPSSAKSPTRMNSALSPRRTSLSEPSSSMVFTFAPKQAPKVSQTSIPSNSTTPGKVTSPEKTDVVFHNTTSPSLSKALSPSLPPSKLESRSKDTPMFKHGLGRRSNSEASINMPNTLTLTFQVSEEKMEDTMKMFDDLLQDAPVTHTATDPADILLWAPVRKDRPTPQTRSNDAAKNQPDPSSVSSTEVKRPLAPPRKSLSSLNKKDEETTKALPEDLREPLSSETSVKEDLVIPETKNKDSHLPPAVVKDDIKKDNVSEELLCQEEILIPEIKAKDSHLPPSFMKSEKVTEDSKEPEIEDLIVPALKTKDSHLPPASLLPNDKKELAKDTPRDVNNSNGVLDYDHMFRNHNERDSSQNIIANQLAADIVKEEQFERGELLLKNSMKEPVNKKGNIPANEIANSIQMDNSEKLLGKSLIENVANTNENIPAEEIAKEILNKTSDENERDNVTNKNIPANEIAKEIIESSETSVAEDRDVLVDIDGFTPDFQFDNQSEESTSGTSIDASYASQANEIVQTVIAQISSRPELLLNEEKTFSPIEPASAGSSDDEPPPLPGAPPPPVIFRSNSEMLTDTAWLDNNVTKPNEEVVESDETRTVAEEDIIESVSANKNNHALITAKEPVVDDTESKESKLLDYPNLNESNSSDVDLNIVSQNIAHVISKDMSGGEEELSHTKSDFSEQLNSTGENSFQEADAIRLHSPASVDVLSEDSGMPGDEEFQEVNTDDAISPVNEFNRENEIKEANSNVFTSKSSFYQNSSVQPSTPKPEIVQHVNDSLVDVSLKSQSQTSSQQTPNLPSSLPPVVPVASDSFENLISSDSVSQSSDFPPSSNEVPSPGEQVTKKKDEDTPTVVENIVANKDELSEESVPVISYNNDSSVNKLKETDSEQHNNSLNPSLPNENKSVNKVEGLTVQSKRKWRLSSNAAVQSLVLEGLADTVVHVDYKSETLNSALPPSDFVSLLVKANEVLDSLSASEDLELFVVHIHREGETTDLGIDLKTGSFYKVTKIKKDSPLAKEGSVMVDDWLIAVDNLWFPEVSLMRCLARLTKPKHNSLLVLARGQRSPLPSPATTVEPSKERSVFSTLNDRVEEKASSKPDSHSVTAPKPTPPQISPRSDKASRPETSLKTLAEVPQAASAEQTATKQEQPSENASEPGGIMNVMMMKGATGVGFCLEGGVGSPKGNVPIIIKRIFKGGPAEKCGQLKVKDEILSVNGVDFTTLRHYEAWNHLKFLDDGEVHFKIRRAE